MFLLFFNWFGRMNPLPTYPKEWDQNQVVHSQKLFGTNSWVKIQGFLTKYFWSFAYLIFFGKKIFLN